MLLCALPLFDQPVLDRQTIQHEISVVRVTANDQALLRDRHAKP